MVIMFRSSTLLSDAYFAGYLTWSRRPWDGSLYVSFILVYGNPKQTCSKVIIFTFLHWMRSSFSFLEHVWTAIKLGLPSTFGHFPKKSSRAFPLETLKSWTKTREESWGQLRRLMVVVVQPGLEVWRGRSGYKELPVVPHKAVAEVSKIGNL